MYYSNGNYEAFARPVKPEGVDEKSAYLIGSGLASLAAACFLVRDGQMKGEHIHILESSDIAGGACDGIYDTQRGYIMRGGREMDNHFECMWDLFRSIPSTETEGVSVLDEYYWLNKKDPNYSLCRATVNQGTDAHTDGKFTLNDKAEKEVLNLFLAKDEDLYNKKISDVFDEDFYQSNFWLYWQTMFAFQKWSSALEMKLYLQRYVHHIGGLPDFTALRFTKYNQYDSMIKPMVRYLQNAGVDFQYGVRVTNVYFQKEQDKKTAKRIDCVRNGKEDHIDLEETDLVFVTNGSCTESSAYGDQMHAPVLNVKDGEGESWQLWKKIAAQSDDFGHPDKFCGNVGQTTWESATIAVKDPKILSQIEKICRRDPLSGKVVTGGIITVKDSSWLCSWTINRQPQFIDQPKDTCLVWFYALNMDTEGDYIHKKITECTGEEITEEWLYHIGMEKEEIPSLASACNATPVIMPYITAFFQPREKGDRPLVVPKGCVNCAFIGQFADTARDTVFTTEYSIRTGMEAVYTLLNVDRGVPEVYGSVYDVRCLLDATYRMGDEKKLADIKLPWYLNGVEKKVLAKIKDTCIEDLLKEYHLL